MFFALFGYSFSDEKFNRSVKRFALQRKITLPSGNSVSNVSTTYWRECSYIDLGTTSAMYSNAKGPSPLRLGLNFDNLLRCTPMRCTLVRRTPVRYTPVRCTSVRYTPMRLVSGVNH
jgi:hypothetical protein